MNNEALFKIYNALREPCEALEAFRGMHLFFFLAMGLVTYLLVRFFRNCSFATFKVILFCFWLTVFILEILRQFFYCVRYDPATESFIYKMQLYSLPRQLCAMQHYMLPAILLLPRGKASDAAMLFMATYSLIGGLAVMLNPATISTTLAFINVQGLVHHGIQCIAGVFIIAHEHAYFEKKSFLHNFLLFLSIVGVVLILNEHAYELAEKLDVSPWNLFFLSPHTTSNIKIIQQLREVMTHTQFVIGYILTLTLASLLLYVILAFVFRKTDKRYISNWR